MPELAEASAPVLYAKAREVADQIKGSSGYSFDPTIIITILIALLKGLGVCGVSRQRALFAIQNPGRLAMRKLRRECADYAVEDSEEFNALVDGVRDMGDRLTKADVNAMYAEAGV